MIILTFAFGTIVAMGMPIITAVIGLVVGLSAIGLMGHIVGVPDIAPTLATMIGLGVGIDYSLFLVSRHRRQIAAGMEMRESIATTVATSGGAVVFAGGTVVIALVSLAVAGIPLVTSLGYASAVAVLTAVLAAITLLPALLGVVGRHIESVRLPAFLRPKPKEPGTGLWDRWGRAVTNHPLIAIAASVIALGILAIPIFSLELGQEDIGATPKDTTERQAYDLMTRGLRRRVQRPAPDRREPGHARDRPIPRCRRRRTRPTPCRPSWSRSRRRARRSRPRFSSRPTR